MSRTGTIEVNFWPKVAKGTPLQCWEWMGGIHPNGYGFVRIGGRRHKTHRFSYEIHFGPIPEGLCALHRCDNRRCVNPAHLFLGTVRDNNADMFAKGRQVRGVQNGNAKLTDDLVRRIRHELNSGRSMPRVAADFSVSLNTIDDIKAGRTWRHVALSKATGA